MDQVLGDHVQTEHCSDLFGAAQFELTQSTPLLLLRRRLRLDPGKHLLDAPAGIDRLGIALVAGGAPVKGGAACASGVLGHVGRDADATHLSDKALGVVPLVGANSLLVGTALVTWQSTIRAWRLSMSTWPR